MMFQQHPGPSIRTAERECEASARRSLERRELNEGLGPIRLRYWLAGFLGALVLASAGLLAARAEAAPAHHHHRHHHARLHVKHHHARHARVQLAPGVHVTGHAADYEVPFDSSGGQGEGVEEGLPTEAEVEASLPAYRAECAAEPGCQAASETVQTGTPWTPADEREAREAEAS